jgi:hypothetical protein
VPSIRRIAILTTGLGLLLAVSLLLTATASANIEQVGTFAGGEKSPLSAAQGMAVNVDGAAGVTPGTIYAVVTNNRNLLLRYSPKGELLESINFEGTPRSVAVDQATGNIYVLRSLINGGSPKQVLVYSPDGSQLITSFGEAVARTTESIDATPEKFHAYTHIAVDESGTVYVSDLGFPEAHEPGGQHRRVMVFKQQTPGDYEHYAYTGQANDIAAGGARGYENEVNLVTDFAGNLYLAGDGGIAEFAPGEPLNPICTFDLPSGGIQGMTINPETGEVFYDGYHPGDEKGHQLAVCNSEGKFVEAGTFSITPKSSPGDHEIKALTFNPSIDWEATRPQGVLYAANQQGLGYFFAGAKEFSPAVESESVSRIGATSATLGASINPKGAPTSYAFQYLDDAAYGANEPDERQSLTVSAGGGVFGLGLEGHHLGGPASANLTAGSKVATALATVKGTATLKGALGTGTLTGAEGKGTLIAGSNVITSVNVAKGTFEAGQGVAGAGIPTETKITAVKPEAGLSSFEIRISRPATQTATGAEVTSGAPSLTEVSTSEGTFEVGQTIEGEGIPSGTTITAVKPGELTLSSPATKPGAGLAVHAGFPTLTSVSPSLGSFEVGQKIEGEGIVSGTTILAIEPGQITLSSPVSKPGTAVAISSPGPAPWAVGEQVEGPGIPQGTTITSTREGGGEATLSNAATASGSGVVLHAGLPANASAAKVRAALEGLPTIGQGNVKVSGGPGDETGSSPYEVTFTGKFENVDVAQLSTDASGLSGGPATAIVATENNGGGGFAGALEVPPDGAELGGGQSPLSAAASLSGLAPDTGYHFRAVATSHCSSDKAKVCEGLGASEGFRTFPTEAPTLPDGRAYELVSPVDKHGGEVFPAQPTVSSCGLECKPGFLTQPFPMQSSPDGEGVVYEGFPFSFNEGAVQENQYISHRNASSGWETTILSPALQGNGEAQGYTAFSADLTQGLLYQRAAPLSPEAPSGYADLYGQPTSDPSALAPLLTEEPPNRPQGRLKLTYVGASADLSHVFFEANDALTGETPFAPEAVDGGEEKNNLYEWAEGQLRLVNVLPGNTETMLGTAFGSGQQLVGKGNLSIADVSYAISADGSRAFWSSESGQVYVRENGEVTREIPDHVGKFATASADGSKLLLSDGNLFDLEDESSIDLTEGKGGFEGISGQSEDLSSIYFVDTKVLDETPNNQGSIAEVGKNNLYAWHEGASRFVATLLPQDSPAGRDSVGAWKYTPNSRTAEASPNGQWLAFLSKAPLTGYDNTGPCETNHLSDEGFVSAPCKEVFLYDSRSHALVCASCNPSGERPIGPSLLRVVESPPQNLPQPRYLTDSGRLYFDSQDSLSPFDTNGVGVRPGHAVEDVYQYEPEGVGSCKHQGGCVNLISAGHEPVDSNLLTIDESGKNVFFTSQDKLVLKDKDGLFDLYDAREGGGIPGETETGRGECQGEACQAPVSPPNDPTPGSSTFQGAGNVTEPKAAEKHAKKHKKKHAKKKHAHKRAAKHNRGGAK